MPRYLARALTLVALFTAFLGGVSAPAASAAVYPTCTMSRCADARTAHNGWRELGFPTARAWYAWPYGKYNFSGGRFYNREGQLPAGRTYQEYDVYPRAQGASRDAYRIVRDTGNGTVWFSPDHYGNFYRL